MSLSVYPINVCIAIDGLNYRLGNCVLVLELISDGVKPGKWSKMIQGLSEICSGASNHAYHHCICVCPHGHIYLSTGGREPFKWPAYNDSWRLQLTAPEAPVAFVEDLASLSGRHPYSDTQIRFAIYNIRHASDPSLSYALKNNYTVFQAADRYNYRKCHEAKLKLENVRFLVRGRRNRRLHPQLSGEWLHRYIQADTS